MTDDFANVYADRVRAEAYAGLEFPGTYFLAFRDLPGIFAEHVRGTRALDFGCGAGRSTRFLERLGFTAIGVDISEAMLVRAREHDPAGDYRHCEDLDTLPAAAFDLVFAAFPFDNVPSGEKDALHAALARRLAPDGRLVSLVSTADIYLHEWASFSTRDFPENARARSGDRVRIVMLDVPDRRPVEDVLCTDDEYRDVWPRAGLRLVLSYRPLGASGDGIEWKSETTIAPWAIHVLERAGP